jgi:hypothetical protein
MLSTTASDEKRASRKSVTKIDAKNGIELSESTVRHETKAVVHM